jgi:peptidoglycan/xylan/chitin deacetylase (PgdA/CDA1 family)
VRRRLGQRLRKAWHLVRRRSGAGRYRPRRLVVEKARWLGDARSPVMLMVDDLTNAWHNSSGGGSWEPRGDWGGGLKRPGSTLAILESGLFRDFADVKTTFFTVAGPISPYTHHQPFSFAKALDADEQSRQFFRSLAENPRYELAYHGFDHGTSGATSNDFLQEWKGFASTSAAVEQTRRGLEIFRNATGTVPRGGKYGGWAYNEFAEAALNECGFTWWCRDWTPRDIGGSVADGYYEPQFFGRNLVVSLPSTVHGFFWDRRQVDLLLQHGQVIAIAEHISPVRPDGQIQTPNLFDDMEELRRLFRYLRGKDVWHATGSEIASYVVARERSLVHDVTADGFSIRYCGPIARPNLTLKIDATAICTAAQPSIDVFLPDGTLADRSAYAVDGESYRHCVTVPVSDGRYRVVPRPNAPAY